MHPPVYVQNSSYSESWESFCARLKKSAELDESHVLWATQLRMIAGSSADKAAAIVARFPSLQQLIAAYDACGGDAHQEAALLADIPFGLAGCVRALRLSLA